MRLLYAGYISLLLLTGCTGLKYIPKEERLYTGAKISTENTQRVKEQGAAVSESKKILRPKPNTKILWGARPPLWFYYIAGTPKKEKGFRYWMKTKLGEPPVYLSSTEPSLVSQAIDARLYNKGFFDSYSQYEIVESHKGKTASITYKLFLYDPYMIDTIVYPTGKDTLSRTIAVRKHSLLKEGDRYDLEVLLNERVRIDDRLKQHGFYYFNEDMILFRMDTSLGKREVRLFITIKDETPVKARLMYQIAEVNIFPDYKLGRDSAGTYRTIEVIDSVNYYNGIKYIRPEPVIRSVFLKNRQVYDRRKHNLTLNRLNGLGVFKFVNVRITDKDTTVPGWLNTDIFLTPLPKKTISMTTEMATKSNNFTGPGVTVGLRNRNAFRGAELMIYNIRGSFETQFNGPYKGKFTYEFNPRIELYVPRFMMPFHFNKQSPFVPRTKFILDYTYMSRVGYFDLNSLRFMYGYRWKPKLTIDHDLSVVNINYFHVYNIDPAFSDLMESNVFLQRKFEEQFIAGIAYSFFYNEQVKRKKRHQLYFNSNSEIAGNALSLYKKIVEGEQPNSDNPLKVFGINYSQYLRLDIDIRSYLNFDDKNTLASRFIAGWGIPYGNSSTIPYVKQFFSGGAYSVRGFQAYSIGPGSYAPPDSLKNLYFLQQGGEIKLEGNVEYRFPIAGMFRGAFFVDAGNVWLNHPVEGIPGGEFKWNQFISEIAVGIGTGIRVDLSFFVIRLDLGIPARKPWLPQGQRWVLDQFDPLSSAWRRENLILNIAFGYPF